MTHERSSLLGIHTPEEHSTPVVAEEIDLEALIKTGNITHPPSPISEVSPHTQEASRPSDMGQKPCSHRGRSMNQSPRIPEATSQILSRKSSGMSWPLNTSSSTSSVVPTAQGASVPDISAPSETSLLQTKSPAHTPNEDINLGNTDQQASWVGILPAADTSCWYTAPTPSNAPPLMADAVQPPEFGFSAHNIGMVFL